jgi:hypothetical protein
LVSHIEGRKQTEGVSKTGCMGEYLEQRERKQQEVSEYFMRTLIIYTSCQYRYHVQIKESYMVRAWERRECIHNSGLRS